VKHKQYASPDYAIINNKRSIKFGQTGNIVVLKVRIWDHGSTRLKESVTVFRTEKNQRELQKIAV